MYVYMIVPRNKNGKRYEIHPPSRSLEKKIRCTRIMFPSMQIYTGRLKN